MAIAAITSRWREKRTAGWRRIPDRKRLGFGAPANNGACASDDRTPSNRSIATGPAFAGRVGQHVRRNSLLFQHQHERFRLRVLRFDGQRIATSSMTRWPRCAAQSSMVRATARRRPLSEQSRRRYRRNRVVCIPGPDAAPVGRQIVAALPRRRSRAVFTLCPRARNLRQIEVAARSALWRLAPG